jgi:adenine-specific DNA-methyltransferase
MLHAAKGEILFTEDDGKHKVNIKDPEKHGTRPNSVADDKTFNATAYGTNLLKAMFGESRVFSYPKALGTVKRALEQMVGDDEEAVVADYFAGSGTTGHAVMEMNREGGSRQYVLVEMAEYVDDVTIKRLKKAAYSSGWSKGLPTESDSLSHTIKIVRLESYEDTLENVVLQPVEEREAAMELFPEFRRELVPARLLRDDVRSSSAYLPAAALAGGSVEISTLDHSGKWREVHVDLSETLSIWLGIEVERRDRRDGIELTVGWRDETPVALVVRSSAKIDSVAVAKALREFLGETEISKLIINGDVALEALRKQGLDVEIETVEELIIGAR